MVMYEEGFMKSFVIKGATLWQLVIFLTVVTMLPFLAIEPLKKRFTEENFFAISIFGWQWNRFLVYGFTWNYPFYFMELMVAEIIEMMANPNATPETKKINLLS